MCLNSIFWPSRVIFCMVFLSLSLAKALFSLLMERLLSDKACLAKQTVFSESEMIVINFLFLQRLRAIMAALISALFISCILLHSIPMFLGSSLWEYTPMAALPCLTDPSVYTVSFPSSLALLFLCSVGMLAWISFVSLLVHLLYLGAFLGASTFSLSIWPAVIALLFIMSWFEWIIPNFWRVFRVGLSIPSISLILFLLSSTICICRTLASFLSRR